MQQTGYTLLELLLVFLISALILVFALPAFQNVQSRSRIANTLAAWQADYHFAKNQAVARGETLLLCPSANGLRCDSSARDYSTGWVVLVASSELVLRDHPLSAENTGLTIRSNVANSRRFLRFQPEGIAPSVGAFQTIEFATPHHKSCLTLASSGRIRQGNCDD